VTRAYPTITVEHPQDGGSFLYRNERAEDEVRMKHATEYREEFERLHEAEINMHFAKPRYLDEQAIDSYVPDFGDRVASLMSTRERKLSQFFKVRLREVKPKWSNPVSGAGNVQTKSQAPNHSIFLSEQSCIMTIWRQPQLKSQLTEGAFVKVYCADVKSDSSTSPSGTSQFFLSTSRKTRFDLTPPSTVDDENVKKLMQGLCRQTTTIASLHQLKVPFFL
jgi:hypothetical protein